ncbi:TsoY family (seleno)protein [Corynebacterium alimapuense]|uniref:Uncharacterized protein n=1 Tax=Corynebacterium alimapuense TaxID=1576874 RepID=A0A3M8K4F1_9CORY|nr:hypothetical protein [Corynebacterium alimapuense]RNE48097.1 hypothetical protein C5L39_09460 [Corynebacterium alimapuense]
MIKNLGEKYSPLYFLAALGFGGMSVFFFMVFMHITPHPGQIMPSYETIRDAYVTGSAFIRTAIVVGYIGMSLMLLIHFALLFWNLRELKIYRGTKAYQALRSSNAEVTMMAIPLTLGMSINGLFVAAMAMIPGLSTILPALMPVALLAYGSVGVLAIYFMTIYLRRVIAAGFDFKANGGMNQLLAAFSFAMVAVGFAAPAAMSTETWIVLVGLLGSLFFGIISVLLLSIFMPIGALSMMRYGLSMQNSATLWLPVPMMTLLAITFLRDRHGLQTLADLGPAGAQEHASTSVYVMAILGAVIMSQLAFLGLGHMVMRRNGFYREFVFGRETASPAAFTLVCPGVALSVLSMFFLKVGLVNNGLIEAFSAAYYLYLAVVAVVALMTLGLAVTLFRNQLSGVSAFARAQREQAAAPAEASVKA